MGVVWGCLVVFVFYWVSSGILVVGLRVGWLRFCFVFRRIVFGVFII